MSTAVYHSVELVDESDNTTIVVEARRDVDDEAAYRWRVVAGDDEVVLHVSSADLVAFGAALRDLVSDEIWTHGRGAADDPFLRTEP